MVYMLHGNMASTSELEKFLFSTLWLKVYVLSSPRDNVKFVLIQAQEENEMSALS